MVELEFGCSDVLADVSADSSFGSVGNGRVQIAFLRLWPCLRAEEAMAVTVSWFAMFNSQNCSVTSLMSGIESGSAVLCKW